MTLANVAQQIAADPEAQYQALQRSLRRWKGFGLLFIHADDPLALLLPHHFRPHLLNQSKP